MIDFAFFLLPVFVFPDWSCRDDVGFCDAYNWTNFVTHKVYGLVVVFGVEPDACVPVSKDIHCMM